MQRGNIPEVFLDTDVAFDIISGRVPHFETSSKLLDPVIKGQCDLVISSGCLANLIYLGMDIYKIEDAASNISLLTSMSRLIHPSKASLSKAFESDFKDKEDALQYYTALENEVDYFITRNIKDYKPYASSLHVYLPTAFINLLDPA